FAGSVVDGAHGAQRAGTMALGRPVPELVCERIPAARPGACARPASRATAVLELARRAMLPVRHVAVLPRARPAGHAGRIDARPRAVEPLPGSRSRGVLDGDPRRDRELARGPEGAAAPRAGGRAA